MRKSLFIFIVILMFSSVFSEEKAITLKGLYFPSTLLGNSVSISNYWGTGLKASYALDYTVDSGIGIGTEMLVKKINDKFEVLCGFNYITERNISWVTGKGKLQGYTDDKYDEVVDSGKIQTTSIYSKGRYLSAKPTIENIIFYVAGKLSYNLVTLSGDLKDIAKLTNGIGYGLSFGSIINDELDIEFALDNIGSAMTMDDGFDTLKGTYSLANTYLSIGYKL